MNKERFVDNGDNTITDTKTGLMWPKNACLANEKMFWECALVSATETNVGKQIGWRLPSRRELVSLIDYSQCEPALPDGHPFVGVEDSYYWSSSTYVGNKGFAWIVDIYSGCVRVYYKSDHFYVWPVRKGEIKNV